MTSPSRVAAVLAETAHGVRVAGDPEQLVQDVGLCGGAGDFLLDRARAAGVDVYLTSDLRHHPASELREHRMRPALVDVAHWAAESTWLPVLRRRLSRARWGDTVEVDVSTINTDPWTFRVVNPNLEENTLKADPFVQLKLLDVQELDSRIDTLTPPAGLDPRGHPAPGAHGAAQDPGQRACATCASRSTTSPPSRSGPTRTSSRSRPVASATRAMIDAGPDQGPQGARADAR